MKKILSILALSLLVSQSAFCTAGDLDPQRPHTQALPIPAMVANQRTHISTDDDATTILDKQRKERSEIILLTNARAALLNDDFNQAEVVFANALDRFRSPLALFYIHFLHGRASRTLEDGVHNAINSGQISVATIIEHEKWLLSF